MPGSLAEALKVRLPVRQRIFDELLARYLDVHCAINSGKTGGDPSSGVLLMAGAWNPSYRALERLLRVYRVYAAKKVDLRLSPSRSDYWHLAQWYFHCKRYPQWPKKTLVQRGRELVEIQPPVRLIVERHAECLALTVLSGLVWLDDEWDRSIAGRRLDLDQHGTMVEMGEPECPKEFRPEVGERIAA